ncbi:MAG: HAD-IA family hydrolase [Bdellovibrionota bacterium]
MFSAIVADSLLIECARSNNVPLSKDDLIWLRGCSASEFWAEVIKKYQISKNVDFFLAQYKLEDEIEGYKNIGASDGVEEVLKTLHSNNIPMALATSGERIRMNAVLDQFQFRKYFKVLLCCEDVTQAKPNPAIFQKTAEELGIALVTV